jgi:ATP-dependent Clp protease ATP-binding subunit ClpA
VIDASNILKLALSRREIQCIEVTTLVKSLQNIEKRCPIVFRDEEKQFREEYNKNT